MKRVFLLIGILAFLASNMYATVLLTEDFNYTVGTAIGEADAWTTTGDITSGDGRIVNEDVLIYPNIGSEYILSGEGKSLRHNYASNKTGSTNGTQYLSYRSFTQVTSGTVYLTYIYKPDGNQNQSNGELLGLTTGTSPSARPWAGKLSSGDTSGETYRLGLTRQSGTSSDIVWGEAVYSKDDIILIVLKYDITNGSASLFVNPALGTAEEPTANIIASTDGSVRTKIDAIMFRNTGASKSNYYVGGVRVCTTWAEAVQAKGELPTDVTLERLSFDFGADEWSSLESSTTDANVNEVDFTQCSRQTGTYYLPTGKKLTGRITMAGKSGENVSIIELPAVTSAERVDIYASAGSDNKNIKLQQYDYGLMVWEDVQTFHFDTKGIYYRFAVTLNSSTATRLRLINDESGAKYIVSVVTYPAAATDLEVPEALEAANVSAHAFSARWTAVSNASGYRIVVYKADGKTQTIKEAVADATSFNITSLTPGTNYTYKVSAIGDDENYVDSYLSDVIEVTTAAEITDSYTRTVTNGNYGTICLPKASNDLSTAGAVFFAVAGKVMNGDQLQEIVLEDVTELVAGTPYVFLATANEINIPLTGEAVEDPVNTGTNGLKGSFAVKSITGTENKYILSQNKLYCTNGQVYYVGENRAYFDISSMSEVSETPAPGRRRVYLATEENQVTTEVIDQQSAINVQKKIVDGKIVIIRNGEMYDLTGQRL